MKKSVLITVFVVLAASVNIYAQDDSDAAHSISINIPEVALLDLEGGSSITLTPDVPTEAGEAFDFSAATDNSIWVNYSSIVASGNSRNVTAAITSGTVPTGLLLKVAASGYSGSGEGTMGSAGSQLTLSGTAQNLVTGIGSCYTGNGANNGHQLTYHVELASAGDYDELVQGNTSITVTYTLTEDE